MKPNKENIITEILIELERGSNFSDCLVLFGTKWNLPRTTFSRYWKTANERHLIKQEATQKAIGDAMTANVLDNLRLAILDKNEALEILTTIAKEPLKEAAMGMVSAKNEQISAIKTIAELEGWNSAIKLDGAITAPIINVFNTPVPMAGSEDQVKD